MTKCRLPYYARTDTHAHSRYIIFFLFPPFVITTQNTRATVFRQKIIPFSRLPSFPLFVRYLRYTLALLHILCAQNARKTFAYTPINQLPIRERAPNKNREYLTPPRRQTGSLVKIFNYPIAHAQHARLS